jgi:hypothetical protein
MLAFCAQLASYLTFFADACLPLLANAKQARQKG